MSLVLSLKNISKTMGSKLLFDNLSFGVFDRERIGLIGPNGAGKTTLLKLIAQVEPPDSGEISKNKNLRVCYVAQRTDFPEDLETHDYLSKYLAKEMKTDELESETNASIYLSICGFDDPNIIISKLSGGWRKRLSIAMAIAQEPEVLILDEPTNHMDWDGILWLESWLKSFKKSLFVVSHDRVFLENVTNRTIEINPLYQNGYLSLKCNYRDFLKEKEDYVAAQAKQEDNLSNKARRELQWLKAGVKARTTKSQSRIQRTHDLVDNLSQVKARNYSAKVKSKIEISTGEKKAKKLIELKNLNISFGELNLIDNLDLTLGPKTCLGLLGKNGSGKTSLLKAISGQLKPTSGTVFTADGINIVYFDQKREALPQDVNLVQFLGDGFDHLEFNGSSIHVASYASRFLFSSEKMHLKISQLSGGEQARLLIAKLLLRPADILILDEPTNDLDIETIEILEEAVRNFNGLVLLVSHDRYFLNTLCHKFLSFDGAGNWGEYAEVNQWVRDFNKPGKLGKTGEQKSVVKQKAKLSYKDKKRLETIEGEIGQAEDKQKELESKLSDPAVIAEQAQVNKYISEIARIQKNIENLYSTWEDLEAKKN